MNTKPRMNKKRPRPGTPAAKARRGPTPSKYVLRLYVAGMTSYSLTAIRSIKRICEALLPRRYDLEVIDLYRHPSRARESDIIVAPTLIKSLPQPLRRLIGNLANEAQVLAGLDLHRTAAKTPRPDISTAEQRVGGGRTGRGRKDGQGTRPAKTG